MERTDLEFTAQQSTYIRETNRQLGNFVTSCDSVISQLGSALSAETLDTYTPNNSFIGMFVSSNSQSHNYAVCDAVNTLQRQGNEVVERLKHEQLTSYLQLHADRISQSRYGYTFRAPFDSNFGGDNIRQSEDAEHTFGTVVLDAVLGNGLASGSKSAQTARVISDVTSRVSYARNQAENLLRQRDPLLASRITLRRFQDKEEASCCSCWNVCYGVVATIGIILTVATLANQ